MKKIKRFQLNNSGSALVMVIVAVVFISILATILLYLSGVNFRMKVEDYNTKRSFYHAETPMEELRTQLIADASKASDAAMSRMMSEYAMLNSAELQKARFTQLFYEEFKALWSGYCNDGSGTPNWEYGIESKISSTYAGVVTVNPVVSGDQLSQNDTLGQLELHGIVVTLTDSTGYTSIIETDFYIRPPEINWGVMSYTSAWGSEDSIERDIVDYTKCVDYLNWTKK